MQPIFESLPMTCAKNCKNWWMCLKHSRGHFLRHTLVAHNASKLMQLTQNCLRHGSSGCYLMHVKYRPNVRHLKSYCTRDNDVIPHYLG